MTESLKRLGATTVTANADTELYQTPASTTASISSIVVCNTGSTARTFRIALVDATSVGSVATEDYIYYDLTIPANQTFICTAGLTMAADTIILVRASHAEVVFSAYGAEVTA